MSLNTCTVNGPLITPVAEVCQPNASTNATTNATERHVAIVYRQIVSAQRMRCVAARKVYMLIEVMCMYCECYWAPRTRRAASRKSSMVAHTASNEPRSALMPASRQMVASSAHVQPPVAPSLARSAKSTSSCSAIPALYSCSTHSLSSLPGSPTRIRASIRPGRTSACAREVSRHLKTAPRAPYRVQVIRLRRGG